MNDRALDLKVKRIIEMLHWIIDGDRMNGFLTGSGKNINLTPEIIEKNYNVEFSKE